MRDPRLNAHSDLVAYLAKFVQCRLLIAHKGSRVFESPVQPLPNTGKRARAVLLGVRADGDQVAKEWCKNNLPRFWSQGNRSVVPSPQMII
ncbi:MAG: hypothetical protein JXA89_01835, partial [Anaerolineae bacterium]|nr:hypothetical protein [Anaerolineae bacterium]